MHKYSMVSAVHIQETWGKAWHVPEELYKISGLLLQPESRIRLNVMTMWLKNVEFEVFIVSCEEQNHI